MLVPRLSLLCLRNEVVMCVVSSRSQQESSFHVCLASWSAFLVVFDLLFAFGVLSCRILVSASLLILYVHEHDRLGFGMLTMETTVFDYFRPRQKKVSLIRPNIVLESGEEYSDGKVHKSDHEPRNGNVNTVYSLIRPGEYSNQSHGVCLR